MVPCIFLLNGKFEHDSLYLSNVLGDMGAVPDP